MWPAHYPLGEEDRRRIRRAPDGRVVWCLWPSESPLNWPGWQEYLTFVQVES